PADVAVEWGAEAHGPDLEPAAPAGDTVAAGDGWTPADRALARQHAATALPSGRELPATISDLATLDAWLARARESGILALAMETSSPDPMQGEPIGIALATAPGHAAYLPLGHRSSSSDLLGAGLLEGQADETNALRRLAPVLADPSVLKIGHDVKHML